MIRLFRYIERFIHDADKSKLRDFLLSDKLTENLVHGYAEQDIVYRRIESEKILYKDEGLRNMWI